MWEHLAEPKHALAMSDGWHDKVPERLVAPLCECFPNVRTLANDTKELKDLLHSAGKPKPS